MSNAPKDRKFISELKAILTAQLKLPDEQKAHYIEQIINEVRRLWGGVFVYIPKRKGSKAPLVIYAQIQQEFDGANYKALAQKYNYSVGWIRDIVHRTPTFKRVENNAKSDL